MSFDIYLIFLLLIALSAGVVILVGIAVKFSKAFLSVFTFRYN